MPLFKIALMLISVSMLIYLFNYKNSAIDSQAALPSADQTISSRSDVSTKDQLLVTHQPANLLLTSDMDSRVSPVDNPPLKQKKAKETPVDTRVNHIARHAQNKSGYARRHGHEDSDNKVVSRPVGEPKRDN